MLAGGKGGAVELAVDGAGGASFISSFTRASRAFVNTSFSFVGITFSPENGLTSPFCAVSMAVAMVTTPSVPAVSVAGKSVADAAASAFFVPLGLLGLSF